MIKNCLDAALATGRISQQKADEIETAINKLERELSVDNPFEVARIEATKRALAAHKAEIQLKKHQTALQVNAFNRNLEAIQAHPDGYTAGLLSLLARDVKGKATYSNIDKRADAILGQLHSHFGEALSQFRTKNLGFTQDKKGLRLMVREIFGEKTGDKNAARFAMAWDETAEIARRRFNRAGGAIPKRSDWGMPQYHDQLRVGKISPDEWKGKIIPLLDREKMRDDLNIKLDDSQLDDLLNETYQTITTGGLNKLNPGAQGGGKLANRHRDHRVLPFKDADSWLKYHDEFGRQDLYATLTDHFSNMAHEISLLEIMGPNPEHMFRALFETGLQNGGIQKGVKSSGQLNGLWNVVSGKANQAESVVLADTMTSVRNLITASRLGSAMLSAISDIAFLQKTAKLNGLAPVKVYQRYLSLLNPKNEADRLVAVKIGLTADAWIDRALAANRFTEVTGTNASAKVADFTMRASGLSAHTDAARKGFGMEFAALLGENVERTLKGLPDELQTTFKRYGIDAEIWDALRSVPTIDYKGAKLFSVENMMGTPAHVHATKFQEMILTETDFAVPTPDAYTRMITTWGGTQRGTVVGEFGARSVMQFKSFPITVIATHLMRGLGQETRKGKAGYLGSLILSTTIMGMVAMQAKEIAKGRDPRDMTDWETWGAAFLQGGGAGIYGDFLFADANRFGQSLVATAAGPFYSSVEDARRLSLGNVQQLVTGDDMNFGSDLAQFVRANTPAASLWYGRLAFDRMLVDQLELMSNPKAAKKFDRQMKKRLKEQDQAHYWKKGSILPGRGPDINAAIGE